MAHVAKYNKGALGHMFKHYERATDEKGEYIKFGNESIDISKSHLNYNLAPDRNISQGEFVKQRCSEVKCLNRKDVNVMCSWVVTAPEGLQKGNEKEFFEQTYKFLENRYGSKNVISSHVHMDEVTPHMHFAFVPVIYDPKNDIEKVSAKLRVSKTDLQTFHKDLENTLENHFGYEVGILNGSTKEGNKSIVELKRQQLHELNNEYDKSIEALKSDFKVVKDVKGNISAVESIEAKKSFIGAKISISESDYNNLKDLAKQGIYNSNKVKSLDEENKNLKSVNRELMDKQYNSYNKISELRKENLKLKDGIKDLKIQAKAMYDTIKEHGLIPKAQERADKMREAQKVADKVLNKQKGLDLER